MPDDSAPNRERFCPYPALVPGWYETWAFAFLVAAASTETHTSRVINGPFRITHTSWSQSGADMTLVRLHLSTDDSDAVAANPQALGPQVPLIGDFDTASAVPGFGMVVAPGHSWPNTLLQAGVYRLSAIVENAGAAEINVGGFVEICHLRAGPVPAYYAQA